MKKLFTLLLIMQVLLQSACSAFVSGQEEVRILASEKDALIYANGDLVGKGKATFTARKDRDISIMVKKTGFKTETRHISSVIGGWGIIDIGGAFLWFAPIIGLAFPGSRKLETNYISIPLENDL